MPTITTQVKSSLPAEEVLRVLTDFGPSRADAWPGVDPEHLQVHESGENWADVTEGNSVGWERERYSWDAAAGTVSARTTDSNLWATGSGWEYKLTPTEGGTLVDVTVTRQGKGVKGKLVGALLVLIGRRMTRAGLAQALQTV